jgi:hypothetical protein
VKRLAGLKSLSFLSFFLCLGLGCSGSGGSKGTQAENPLPALTAVNPNLASAGSSAFTLAASGSNFISASQIEWNGTALTTTYVSGTSLTAQIPASDLTTSGTASITVQNPAPGGGTSSAITFTIGAPPNPVPTITSLAPTAAYEGGPAFTLTVAGAQFISSSQVVWNGNAVATAFVSSTSLTAQIPASDLSSAGTAAVAVQNPAPGGGTSNTVNFMIDTPPNPVPTIGSLSPSSASAGGPVLILTVGGTQFISTSQVLWNGDALPTTFVSSTSLTAQIPASDLTSSGTASITVQNPAPGGGTSSSQSFTISSPANNLTVLNIAGNDITWDPSQKKIYVAVPSTATVNPGTVTAVDPIAGSVGASQSLASAPSGLAISDDSQYLYAVIGGGLSIQRLTLPSLTPDIQWSLGNDSISGEPNFAGDIKVQPGASRTVAVALGEFAYGSVAVFDDAVERPQTGQGGNSLQWKADGSELYSTYTLLSDNPGELSVSDDALFTMPVNSSGVGAATVYDSSFRGEGVRFHADATTGYVYGDWGEVVNPSNGIPVGDYAWSRPYGTYSPGAPISAVDSALNRIYTLLEVKEPSGALAFQIQAFDLTKFKLLDTIYIPAGNDSPTNFIRWGESGLAFVTNGAYSGASGGLYILDGAFVNPSGQQDTVAGTPIFPVPTLTAMNPITAPSGSGGVTVTITGRDFNGQPTVYWNGSALPTTALSSTQVAAQIPASDLAAVGLGSITVSNGSSTSPVSNSLPFSVNSAPPSGNQISVYSTGGNDLVWDASTAKLYVSMPGVQGDAGNGIGVVDPIAGTVTNSGFLGSEPARLSISNDSQYLYMALNGQNAMQQLTLPNFQVNAAWNLGGVGTFFGPNYALDVQAAPQADATTAVTMAAFDESPSPVEVVIYDGPTARPNPLQAIQYPYSALQWAGNDSTLYALDQQEPQDFLVLGANAGGPVLNTVYDGVVTPYTTGLHYDGGTGLIYTDGGQVIQPSNGTIAGTYNASGIAVPDSTLDRVFILGQTSTQVGTSSYTVESFDQTKFTAIASITIDNVVGTPTAFVRWGSNGLAFTTRVGEPYDFLGTGPGQLYVISGVFVKPTDSASQVRSVQVMAPVRRTWGLNNSAKSKSRSVSVRPSPFAQ